MSDYPRYVKPREFTDAWDRFDYQSCAWLRLYDHSGDKGRKGLSVEYGFNDHLFGNAILRCRTPTTFLLLGLEAKDIKVNEYLIIKYDDFVLQRITPVRYVFANPLVNGAKHVIAVSTIKLYTVWELDQ